MDAAMLCQEFGQAMMWLGCAFVGFIASSLLLNYLGCKKFGPKTIEAKASSKAFQQEVALYANKTCISDASRHFGISEKQVQEYCSRFGRKSVQGAETAEETQSAGEAPLFTAPSVHPGHVLLEHYDVFNPREGAWSGPLEDAPEEPEDDSVPGMTRSNSVPIPLDELLEVKAEEFFEGDFGMSLWLVPDGHIYDHDAQCWHLDDST